MKWQADLGNGNYKNPILYVDYSDPDAIRVEEDYYMTASSFTNVPGLPVLHSRDLVNWELINYALKNVPEFRYREPQHGCGVWAPSIRFHQGTYYICFPMPDEGLFMVTAKDPAGEWSEPVKIYEGAGYIDPCPFWDDDGKAYLVCGVAKSRIGYKSVLHMWELRPDGLALIGGPVKIYDGNLDGNVTTEGPKLYKKNGYYYIFAPAGGVKTGWQIVLRSKKIYGPYEVRTVMVQGSTGVNGPHQGAWVDTVMGEDWFLHFQDVFAAGRITHLQPMTWGEDGWPVIGRPASEGDIAGEPVLEWKKPDVGDNVVKITDPVSEPGAPKVINGTMVTPWQWNANSHEEWLEDYEILAPDKEKEAAGDFAMDTAFTLCSVPVAPQRPLADFPNLFLRKWEAPEFEARAKLDFTDLEEGGFAGMISMGMQYGGIGVIKKKGIYGLCCIKGKQIFDGGAVYAEEGKTMHPVGDGETREVYFSLRVIASNDVTAVSPKPQYTEGQESMVLHPEAEVALRAEDARGNCYAEIFLPATAGRWVGAKYGFFHTRIKGFGEKEGKVRVLTGLR